MTCSLAPMATRRKVLLARFFRSEEHTSELQSQSNLVCRLLLEKKKNNPVKTYIPLPSVNSWTTLISHESELFSATTFTPHTTFSDSISTSSAPRRTPITSQPER